MEGQKIAMSCFGVIGLCEDDLERKRGSGRKFCNESFASHAAFDFVIRGDERICK